MRKTRTFSVREPGSRDLSGHGVVGRARSIDNADILQRVERLKREIDRDKEIIRGRSSDRTPRAKKAETAES